MDVVYFHMGMDTVLWTWFTFRWGWTQFYGRGLLSDGDGHSFMDVVYFQLEMDTVLWTWFTFSWRFSLRLQQKEISQQSSANSRYIN